MIARPPDRPAAPSYPLEFTRLQLWANGVVAGRLKWLLTRVGAIMPPRGLHVLQCGLNYMKVGRWAKDQGFVFPKRFTNREEVFAVVAEQIKDRKVLYLEFGVFRGAATRYWSAALKNPNSLLHGFDSFQGLPEDFHDLGGALTRGYFSTGGQVPQIDDDRVTFFRGWFDEVLPGYKVPDHDVLVLNMDADLYSSTIYVLRHFRPYIKRGTFVYFDDLSSTHDEPRAFTEFMRESGLKFRHLAAHVSLNQAFFVCEG
jgi:hypothetical protein